MLTPKPLVIDLLAATPDELELVGGKAANLGVLLRAGFAVPPGACVTTVAYSRSVGSALEDVVAALAATEQHDTERLSQLAAQARARVLAAEVPDDVAAVVRGTATGPVAVRSSATAEDLPFASFAGQQDTYLNVVGADAVLDAVRRCWASLWTDRAVAYRAAQRHRPRAGAARRGRPGDGPRRRSAGVMFTANPVTGRRREAVIDASPGLGEAVVSGAVNPDHFVVDTATGRILERRLGDKRAGRAACAGGGVEHVERTSDGDGGRA